MTHFGNTVKRIKKDDDFMAFINPAPWNKVYKRESIKNFTFYPLRGFNDTLFLITCYTKIQKIAFLPDILYHYYLRYDSQIHTVNKQDVENLKKYLLEVKKVYKETKKYDEYKYILDLMAFLHLGVSVMYRVSYDENVKMSEMLKNTIDYLDTNFSSWRKSPFLKFSYCIKKDIRHIGLWAIAKLYKWNMAIVYIKLYRIMVDKFKLDIKF